MTQRACDSSVITYTLVFVFLHTGTYFGELAYCALITQLPPDKGSCFICYVEPLRPERRDREWKMDFVRLQ